jgi:steroid 5-alpha reductase family enzyme
LTPQAVNGISDGLYLWAIAAIALSLSVLMAGAWMVQQRTGNSG